jgi:nucleotide-binding universal stress UspA family protein
MISVTTRTTVERRRERVDVLGRVIAGFDASLSSIAAVEWAAHEADLRGCTLRIVTCWVMPEPVDFYGVGADQTHVLAEAARSVRVRYPGLIVEESATNLDPHGALVAEAGEADLLVVGRIPASPAAAHRFWWCRARSRAAAGGVAGR